MDFSSYVKDSFNIEQNSIAQNSYAKFMKDIPRAQYAFPLIDEKVRGFYNWYVQKHPQTTFSYMISFISAFQYHLKYANMLDFTKTKFTNGLRR